MCHKLRPTARHVAIRRQGTGVKSLQQGSSISEIPPMVSNAPRRSLVLVLALHATVHVGGRRLWRPMAAGVCQKTARVHQPASAGVNMA